MTKQGFTIVELIVAVSLFVTAIAVASGIFISSLRSQRLADGLMEAQSNASLALEQMMREVRTGFDFQATAPTQDCSEGFGDTLAFTRARGSKLSDIVYDWNKVDGDVERTEEIQGSGTPSASVLTAGDVDVERLCFYVDQESSSTPAKVTLIMKVNSKGGNSPGDAVNLQTSVSARILPGEAQ